MADVTTILNSLSGEDSPGSDDLLAIIYDELRRMAAGKMARERPNHTLQPTPLVNEAFLRLAGKDPSWKNRRHFTGPLRRPCDALRNEDQNWHLTLMCLLLLEEAHQLLPNSAEPPAAP